MKLSFPAMTCALLVCASTTFAAEVVSTTNLSSSGFQSSGFFVGIGYESSDQQFTNEAAAQEFFPELSGVLTTLTATVDLFRGGEPLHVSIYTSVGGVPGVNLGTATIPQSEITTFRDSSWVPNTFDLSSLNIMLDAGQSYVAVFQTDTPVFQSVRYRALRTATNENSYGVTPLISPDGGQTWQSVSFPPEIGLTVRVMEPTPEPVEAMIAVEPDRLKLNGKPKPFQVVVFSDEGVDATMIDPESALIGDPVLTDPDFGSGKAGAAFDFYYADIDQDGMDDLILEFDSAYLLDLGAIDSSTTVLALDALTAEGQIVFGTASVESKGKGNQGKGKGRNK